ncbi:ATP-binding protein [Dyadobacter sp. CY343]|uniref:ATP-binding protein n=1 Tax=Dyadobacter sp. CY343 TaxID=2907299 RepID=UPI001F387CF4|nr:ATP-binding protein [Dyadobacter sp. CY343]MCE7062176.1 ATP-binding protein [Dyadobacter sp. CY343]
MKEYETNIPALLLQPLVENAVKHGVAGKGEAGHIELLINKSGHDMVIILKDNGEGISEETSVSGLGLKLTRDRISLLNQIHPGRQINLTIKNTVPKGAHITLTFDQWFDEGNTDRR